MASGTFRKEAAVPAWEWDVWRGVWGTATARRVVRASRTESSSESRLADLVYSDLYFLLHGPHKFGFVTTYNPDWVR